ncbi:sigma 54-interacting transcriptional regulator [Chryseobacterium sp. B21-037]|uniref:sigma-54 interaction domain-containing protein n=1 Tax=Chryseobacterium sp. B21-037 TaxID=2926038 RepID=UPI0023592D87|nr:sigma 54-interacting transcriptional regulator [Chryseobacterium sp. B21-037]MDC8104579.1 sigma 54-interacting transcriptional regulator [Chryseobacterium sp. B21-037]
MSKPSDPNAEMMKRLQGMQKEQLIIARLAKDFSTVLNKKQLLSVLNTSFKNELGFNDCMIVRDYRGIIEMLISGIENQNYTIDHALDTYLKKCLDSAEPLFFDLKELSSFPSCFTEVRNSGMRMAVGLGLPAVNENKNVLFLFYRNFISRDAIPERILNGVSTQVSITLHNIDVQEQLKAFQENIQNFPKETEEENKSEYGFHGIVGQSEIMQTIFEQISQAAPSQSNVIIFGETGTGKELIAKAIHELSEFSGKKMVRINCAAIPANLIESELFGHEKGSFTGATEQRKGKFEQAHNSTIFLDEIGELPLELQARLLRVLQEKEIERIGGNKRIKVNVRIITATNRNLEKEVAEGRFRSDLFYRLNVFPIHLPALRERKDDIPLLADYFLEKLYTKTGKKINGFSQNVVKMMIANPWLGNIRELENMVERSMLTAKGNMIRKMDFPKVINSQNTDQDFRIKTLQEFEKEYILKIIKKCNGRIFGETGAAKLLGLPPTTLISKMQKLGIEKKHYFKGSE